MKEAVTAIETQPAPHENRLPAKGTEPLASLQPILIGIAYLALWQIAPRLRTDSEGAVVTSTLVALSISVWFAASAARVIRTGKEISANAILSGLLVIPMRV